ncbi:hypothetical protein D3C86_1975110 [compost metagenome]
MPDQLVSVGQPLLGRCAGRRLDDDVGRTDLGNREVVDRAPANPAMASTDIWNDDRYGRVGAMAAVEKNVPR